jgi:hypothetical protein
MTRNCFMQSPLRNISTYMGEISRRRREAGRVMLRARGVSFGSLAIVRDLRDSLAPQKSRFFWDFQSLETPLIVRDLPKTHS